MKGLSPHWRGRAAIRRGSAFCRRNSTANARKSSSKLFPACASSAILADANVTKPAHLKELEEAARSRGVEPLVRGVAKRGDVIAAVKEVKSAGAEGINFLATPLFSVNAVDFILQVRELGLASIYQWPEDAEDGGLIAMVPAIAKCTGCVRGWL